jgi:indolepyruvate ferredoxin oxidoreductase alpha subunit
LLKLCEAIGVERVTVADPFDIDNFEKVVKAEIAADEPSVIISQRPCALLKSVKYPGPLCIDKTKCVNCKMCMKIGCPALTKNADGTVKIDESMCNG